MPTIRTFIYCITALVCVGFYTVTVKDIADAQLRLQLLVLQAQMSTPPTPSHRPESFEVRR
jgi:hypothetical protein